MTTISCHPPYLSAKRVVLPRAFLGIADEPYDIARQLLTLPDHLKTDCFSVHFIKVVLTIAAQQTLAVVQFSN